METIIIAGVLSVVAYFLGFLHGLKSGTRYGAYRTFEALAQGGIPVKQIEAALEKLTRGEQS